MTLRGILAYIMHATKNIFFFTSNVIVQFGINLGQFKHDSYSTKGFVPLYVEQHCPKRWTNIWEFGRRMGAR